MHIRASKNTEKYDNCIQLTNYKDKLPVTKILTKQYLKTFNKLSQYYTIHIYTFIDIYQHMSSFSKLLTTNKKNLPNSDKIITFLISLFPWI